MTIDLEKEIAWAQIREAAERVKRMPAHLRVRAWATMITAAGKGWLAK